MVRFKEDLSSIYLLAKLEERVRFNNKGIIYNLNLIGLSLGSKRRFLRSPSSFLLVIQLVLLPSDRSHVAIHPVVFGCSSGRMWLFIRSYVVVHPAVCNEAPRRGRLLGLRHQLMAPVMALCGVLWVLNFYFIFAICDRF